MWYNYYVVGGQAPGPDPKGHEMKLSAEVRADAKKYNAQFSLFEAVNQETGAYKIYTHYGVAYRYTAARVRRGENWRIYGVNWDDDAWNDVLEERGAYVETELCAC